MGSSLREGRRRPWPWPSLPTPGLGEEWGETLRNAVQWTREKDSQFSPGRLPQHLHRKF